MEEEGGLIVLFERGERKRRLVTLLVEEVERPEEGRRRRRWSRKISLSPSLKVEVPRRHRITFFSIEMASPRSTPSPAREGDGQSMLSGATKTNQR